jgi:non-specific serine/threonine protein kinase
MPTAATLEPGSTLSGFRIDSQIGRGGMGVVYRATQLSLDRHVALKLIAPEIAAEQRFRERFLREAQLAASLEHPHLLPVYEAGEVEGTLFVALRLVEGCSLADLLGREGVLNAKRAVRLFAQVCSALEAAHGAGLLHRDIKPANVLIAGEADREHAYLCDFGLARRLSGSSLTAERAFVGTATYAAPEQIRGEELDPRCDLYALSCLLYECLIGRPPFTAEDELALLWAHLNEPAPLPSSADPTLAGFDSLFAKSLAKEPHERFASATELAQAAQAALQGTLPAQPPATTPSLELPRPATPFLGREHELAEALELLLDEGVRLLTLSGPGGTGKTRLALRAAEEAAPAFPEGVYWVGLAALRDPTLLVETISQALDAKIELSAHIAEKRLLLLLDNFEQVVDGAPALASLLQDCPNLTLLVTSRELLRVQAEVEYPVPPLAEPEAISLFCTRSRLEPSAEIADLCARLDNLPLAVELAAARTKALSPAQILERLSERLDLLKGGRDADPRQETLRATIEWSHDLLAPEEQQLFARLAVFAGGCTLEAAEEVSDADIDTLQTLVEKNLLRFSGERYQMLETVREYAIDRMFEHTYADGVGARHSGQFAAFVETDRERHARYFFSLVEDLKPLFLGPEEPIAHERLHLEHDNLRDALRFTIDSGDADLALRASTGGLQRFWRIQGFFGEGRRWLEEALAGVTEPALRANGLRALANIAGAQGDAAAAIDAAAEAVPIFRDRGDVPNLIDCLNALGGAVMRQGDLQAARRYFEEVEQLSRASDDTFRLEAALGNLGVVALYEGAFDRAGQLFAESLDLARELGLEEAVAHSLLSSGMAAFQQGDHERAGPQFREALEISSGVGDLVGVVYACECLGAVLAAGSNLEPAVIVLSGAENVGVRIGIELEPLERRIHDDAIDLARSNLAKKRFDEAWTAGQAMSQEEVVSYALAALDRRAQLRP